ncbi:MAG: RDD family protein, partial [Nocardioides sp.]
MTVATDAPTLPAADLDRRFYAFVLDRLIVWPIVAVVVWFAYHFLISRGGVGGGFLVIVGGLLLVGLGLAVVLGKVGTSPGKAALGLRVVHCETGGPIGVLPAVQRSLILGVATLPTFGLGAATLAWTAVMDP